MQTGDEGHMGRVQPSPALAYQMIEPNMPVVVATASGGGGTQHSVPVGGCKPTASPEQWQDYQEGVGAGDSSAPCPSSPCAPVGQGVPQKWRNSQGLPGDSSDTLPRGSRASRVAAPAGTHPPRSAGVLRRQAERWDAPDAHLDMSPLLRDTSPPALPPWSLPAPHHGQDRTRTK